MPPKFSCTLVCGRATDWSAMFAQNLADSNRIQLQVNFALPETSPLAPCALAMIFTDVAVGEIHVASPSPPTVVSVASDVDHVAFFSACVLSMLHGMDPKLEPPQPLQRIARLR
jgi:hypothetical protein